LTVIEKAADAKDSDGAQNVRNAFEKAHEEGRGALIGYLMAGDPSVKYTPDLCKALIDGGIDILELGIPFSDPLADGPTIQAAGIRSIEAGTSPADCMEIALKIKQESHSSVPIVFLTYYNTIFHFGLAKFLFKARASGIDGIIVPDLPQIGSSEFNRYIKAVKKNGLATILLATATTNDKRLRSILKETKGFLYLVSLLGVTGVRKAVAKSEIDFGFIRHASLIAHDHNSTNVPVAAGFGISEPIHVQNVLKAGADGAIVGSALVNLVEKNLSDMTKARSELEQFVHSLREATYIGSKKPKKS